MNNEYIDNFAESPDNRYVPKDRLLRWIEAQLLEHTNEDADSNWIWMFNGEGVGQPFRFRVRVKAYLPRGAGGDVRVDSNFKVAGGRRASYDMPENISREELALFVAVQLLKTISTLDDISQGRVEVHYSGDTNPEPGSLTFSGPPPMGEMLPERVGKRSADVTTAMAIARIAELTIRDSHNEREQRGNTILDLYKQVAFLQAQLGIADYELRTDQTRWTEEEKTKRLDAILETFSSGGNEAIAKLPDLLQAAIVELIRYKAAKDGAPLDKDYGGWTVKLVVLGEDKSPTGITMVNSDNKIIHLSFDAKASAHTVTIPEVLDGVGQMITNVGLDSHGDLLIKTTVDAIQKRPEFITPARRKMLMSLMPILVKVK